jgi:hypothetical protein
MVKRTRLSAVKKYAEKRRLKPIPALTLSGGTLKHLEDAKEFRVWAYPKGGGDDYYLNFPNLEQALLAKDEMARQGDLPEEPLAVIWDKKKRSWREVAVPKKAVRDATDRLVRSALY